MATAYRPTRSFIDRRTGERVRQEASKWYARFRDPAARSGWGSRAGYKDKEATEALARRLERDAARRAEGLPVEADCQRLSLERLRGEFVATLAAKERSGRHVRLTEQRLRDTFAGCGWSQPSDLDPDAALRWLKGRRDADGGANAARAEGGGGRSHKVVRFGVASSNHYLRALKAFARWLRQRGVPGVDRAAGVSLLNADVDRRHERRVLGPTEFDRLLAAAREGSPRMGLAGPARATLYLAAAYTGLRAGELGELTADWLDLRNALVAVPAADDKGRKECVLPLHPDLVAELRPLARVSGPLWPGCWATSEKAAKLLRCDLAAAGIPYREGGLVYDFHSLRSQYATDLARAGVPIQVAQKLARHSTPALTAKFYTRLGLGDLADAIGRLPARAEARAG